VTSPSTPDYSLLGDGTGKTPGVEDGFGYRGYQGIGKGWGFHQGSGNLLRCGVGDGDADGEGDQTQLDGCFDGSGSAHGWEQEDTP
jgi:hypothetical protein